MGHSLELNVVKHVMEKRKKLSVTGISPQVKSSARGALTLFLGSTTLSPPSL